MDIEAGGSRVERKTQVLKTGRKVAVCLRGTWGLTSMSVEGII